jgi:hypothetical protein
MDETQSAEHSPTSPPPRAAWTWQQFITWLGIAGGIASIIGLPYAWYLFRASQVEPLLTFAVHPLKTELQRPDFDKKLGFTYDGTPIDTEAITSVQVAVWNAGNKAIKNSDILSPIRLVMPRKANILSALVKHASRDICEVGCVITPPGGCLLGWRILEPGDGAVIQVIYAGPASDDPTLEGTVEGQQGGIVVEQPSSIPRITHVPVTPISDIISMAIPGAIGIILLAFALRLIAKSATEEVVRKAKAVYDREMAEARKSAPPLPRAAWVLLCSALVCLLLALLIPFSKAILASPHGPPFGW